MSRLELAIPYTEHPTLLMVSRCLVALDRLYYFELLMTRQGYNGQWQHVLLSPPWRLEDSLNGIETYDRLVVAQLKSGSHVRVVLETTTSSGPGQKDPLDIVHDNIELLEKARQKSENKKKLWTLEDVKGDSDTKALLKRVNEALSSAKNSGYIKEAQETQLLEEYVSMVVVLLRAKCVVA